MKLPWFTNKPNNDAAIYQRLADMPLGSWRDDLLALLRALPGEITQTRDGVVFNDTKNNTMLSARAGVSEQVYGLDFLEAFPSSAVISGLRFGMSKARALRSVKGWAVKTEEASKDAIYVTLQRVAEYPEEMSVTFKRDKLSSIHIHFAAENAEGFAAPSEVTHDAVPGLNAYDVQMLPREVDLADNKGWVFGLPRGITPQQWPLDPATGFPLVHGFTLRLPQDHRVHGPEIVGFSFFAAPADVGDGGVLPDPVLRAAVQGGPARGQATALLEALRAHAAHAHPKLHWMEDILGYFYAVILLTEEEFRGELCQPPEIASHPGLDHSQAPKWLQTGAAHAFMGFNGRKPDSYFAQKLGSMPEPRLDWHRAIGWSVRRKDPNAGIPPEEVYEEASALGYQSPYNAENDFKLHGWAEKHGEIHIGGTMRPIQGVPVFSPYYIGFEEYFGGYNFGSGNAQLDFKSMKFDWAC